MAQIQSEENPETQPQKIIIQNNYGEKLVGLFRDTGSVEIVVLCHGFRSTKDNNTMVNLAVALEKEGIGAFCFDFAGNGETKNLLEMDSDEDKISKRLPDDILRRILSLIPRNYKSGSASIQFEMPAPCSSNSEVADFMDKIMILPNGMPIQKLHLLLPENSDCACIYRLLCAVMKCHLQELDLCFSYNWPEENPRALWELFMNCKTLVVLSLTAKGPYVLDVPADIWFPCLKTLSLFSFNFVDDSSTLKLFSGCPVLEELFIERDADFLSTDEMHTFSVLVPSLKKLKLLFEAEDILTFDPNMVAEHRCSGNNCWYNVVIDAPKLEFISIIDNVSGDYTLNGLSSLVKANVDVRRTCYLLDDGVYGDHMFGLLRELAGVKNLCLSGATINALSNASDVNLPTFHNLVQFIWGLSDGAKSGLDLLPSLLENMPNLEDLVFKDGLLPLYYDEASVDDSVLFHWRPPRHVPACLLLKLKTIEICNYFKGLNEELKLIEYLLENSKVLETLTFSMNRGVDPQLQQELLKFPRGSTSCQLYFKNNSPVGIFPNYFKEAS